jgi:SAM-dependent methyltransferase
MTSQALKQCGCNIEVYGHGLLQTMYHTPPKNLSEQEKYQLMWQFDSYRVESPGERQAESYLDRVKPDGMIIDFGCGTGRAGLIFKEAGHDVLLMDFASNCRDEEAMALPFLEWDLTNPIPSRANYGYCTDVMEHIPPDDVKTVLKNIMEAAGGVFFQISTIDDALGDFIDTPLHLSVYPHDEWMELLSEVGTVEWSNEQDIASMFYVRSR